MYSKLLKGFSVRAFAYRCIFYALWMILGFIMLFPVFWTLSCSFKPFSEILRFPPEWLPHKITLENYLRIFSGSNIPRQILNSCLIAGSVALLNVAVSTMGGYGFSRWKSRAKMPFLFTVFAMEMITGLTVVIGLYKMANMMGALDSISFLILVYLSLATPFSVWYMKNYFDAIPPDMEEAAIVDGCSPVGALWKIVFPVARPGIAVIAVYSFVAAWNEFLIASVLLTSDLKKTLPLGIYAFIDATDINWGVLCASAILGIIPVILVFLGVQRMFTAGLSEGGLR